MPIFAKKFYGRIIFDIVFFIFIFLLPWYISLPIIALAIIFIGNFWEGALAALAVESFYYTPSASPDVRFGMFFVGAVLLLFIMRFVKGKMRFGGNG